MGIRSAAAAACRRLPPRRRPPLGGRRDPLCALICPPAPTPFAQKAWHLEVLGQQARRPSLWCFGAASTSVGAAAAAARSGSKRQQAAGMAAQDLNGAIDWSAVECLNQKPDHTVQNALKQGWVCRARSAAAAPCRGCCDRWASGRLLLRARGRLCLPVPREPNKSLAAVPAAAAGRTWLVAPTSSCRLMHLTCLLLPSRIQLPGGRWPVL